MTDSKSIGFENWLKVTPLSGEGKSKNAARHYMQDSPAVQQQAGS